MSASDFVLTALAAAVDIRVSELVEPGEGIIVDGVVFIHMREMIRLRHPDGLDGAVAASLEWQLAVIERNAAAARRKLEA